MASAEHPSLLRVARIIAAHSALYKSSILGIPPEELFRNAINKGAYYENRTDRTNYATNLAAIR